MSFFKKGYSILDFCVTGLFFFLFWPNPISQNIQTIRFISLHESIERRETFLKNYNKSKIENLVPLWQHATKPSQSLGPMSIGETGAYLSHMKALKNIAKYSGNDWHLICEDDATGNFSMLPNMLKGVKKRPALPSIQLINLYSPKKIDGRGLGTRLTAYLVTPRGARLASKILEETRFSKAVDVALAESLSIIFHSISLGGIIFPTGEKSTISGHK